MANKLVFGVGINDANYVTSPTINGKQVRCKFYSRWIGMLMRCYDKKTMWKRPTYVGCTVCEEWLTFSNFRSWMERQDWQDKELDKDILAEGNKIYSPKTSVFVDGSVNKFINDSGASRGKYMIGVARRKETHSFAAMCHNGFTGKLENIGYFKTEIDAHNAWKKRKHELACQLADLQTDQRVADALRVRYL